MNMSVYSENAGAPAGDLLLGFIKVAYPMKLNASPEIALQCTALKTASAQVLKS